MVIAPPTSQLLLLRLLLLLVLPHNQHQALTSWQRCVATDVALRTSPGATAGTGQSGGLVGATGAIDRGHAWAAWDEQCPICAA
jgi:hypothetical protein